ncbi:MAG: carboxypeptidase-like regulatory domain-containing protein, partial [Blastocatellia bacterium]
MPSFRRSFIRIVLSVSICLSLGAAAVAARPGSHLHGRTVDTNGAAVSGALIQLSAPDGHRWSEMTDSNGDYSFTGLLQIGTYVVEAEATAFKRSVQNVALSSDEDKTLDFRLDPAGVDAEVVVTASGTAQA